MTDILVDKEAVNVRFKHSDSYLQIQPDATIDWIQRDVDESCSKEKGIVEEEIFEIVSEGIIVI